MRMIEEIDKRFAESKLRKIQTELTRKTGNPCFAFINVTSPVQIEIVRSQKQFNTANIALEIESLAAEMGKVLGTDAH